MQRSFYRVVLLAVSALSAMAISFPARSFADWYRHGYNSPYSRHYDDDDDYGSRYYDKSQQWRDWQRLQHERREMDEARRVGDWQRLQEEGREAKEAARALRRDRQQTWRHHYHDWDDD